MCVCVYIFLFYAQDTQCLVFVSRAIFAYSMRKQKKKKKLNRWSANDSALAG